MPTLKQSNAPTPAADLSRLFPLEPIPSMAAQNLDGKSRVVALYFVGGTHIFEFCKPLGITAFKAGVTGCRDPNDRILDLRRRRYGELLKRPNDPHDDGVLLANADEWFPAPISRDHLGAAAPPDGIEIADGCLTMRVPIAISVQTVDIAVHALLRARTLRDFLGSAEGRRRLVTAGHDPDRWLHTRYDVAGKAPRVTAVEELYLVRPRKELAALASALAQLLKSWSASIA
jgi:hypothetical protein